MRITVKINKALMARARELTDIDENAALLNEGLRALIQRESAWRLAALGGTAPDVGPASRRRSKPD